MKSKVTARSGEEVLFHNPPTASTFRFAVHNSAAGQSRNDTQLVNRGLTRKPIKFF